MVQVESTTTRTRRGCKRTYLMWCVTDWLNRIFVNIASAVEVLSEVQRWNRKNIKADRQHDKATWGHDRVNIRKSTSSSPARKNKLEHGAADSIHVCEALIASCRCRKWSELCLKRECWNVRCAKPVIWWIDVCGGLLMYEWCVSSIITATDLFDLQMILLDHLNKDVVDVSVVY